MSRLPHFESPSSTLVAAQPERRNDLKLAARVGHQAVINTGRDIGPGASGLMLMITIRFFDDSQAAVDCDLEGSDSAPRLELSAEVFAALNQFIATLRSVGVPFEFEAEEGSVEPEVATTVASGDCLFFPRLSIYRQRREVFVDGIEQPLTKSEFDLLFELASRPGVVFSRRQIVLAYKGPDYPVDDRSIDVQMFNLRRKLGPVGKYLQTVRGVGYRFSNNPASI